ncbi:uncharacterized protein LOC133180473 [Saccostrea echinata]|uniref:uncharacterized protein LOC133180473 n=1 Tax=Saccostrea echinata TaxID=191078 RepID=UPI002A8190CF|nr:uncharacterized protein LOC133180473 [Saccostrea echinata]
MALLLRSAILGVHRKYSFCIRHPTRFFERNFVSSRDRISRAKQEILKENLFYYIETHSFKLGLIEALGCFGIDRQSVSLPLSENFNEHCGNWRFIWHRIPGSDGHYLYKNISSSILFAKGYQALNSYINDGRLEPDTAIALLALERFFNEKGHHEECLEKLHDAKEELTEIQVAAILAEHLLSRLLPYPSNYYLNRFSRGKPNECPCGCGVPVQFGFTHLGCPQLFQGEMDFVLFPDNKDMSMVEVDNTASAVFNVVRDSQQKTGYIDCDDRDFELNEDSSAIEEGEEFSDFDAEETLRQTCKQAIAASICKYKGLMNGKLGGLNSSKLCVVPVCSLSRNSYDITAYDARHDFLLKACQGSMKVFEEDNSLKFAAMVDLWLMINHNKFCTAMPPRALNSIKGTCKLVPQLGEERFMSAVRNSTWLYQASIGKKFDYLPTDPSITKCVNEQLGITWRD